MKHKAKGAQVYDAELVYWWHKQLPGFLFPTRHNAETQADEKEVRVTKLKNYKGYSK